MVKIRPRLVGGCGSLRVEPRPRGSERASGLGMAVGLGPEGGGFWVIVELEVLDEPLGASKGLMAPQ